MIRINHQRILRQRLPVKFLTITLLIALLWFIVMFLYVDDLITDEAKDTRIQQEKVRSRLKKSVVQHFNENHGAETVGGLHHLNGNVVVYDNETGKHLEIERVEDEYVDIWEHGKWVKATERAKLRMKVVDAIKGTTILDTSRPFYKTELPLTKIRKTAKVSIKNSDNNPHKDDDFILVEEDTNNDTKNNKSIHKIPQLTSKSLSDTQTTMHLTKSYPHRENTKVEPAWANSKGNEDFHFAAQRDPSPFVTYVPKTSFSVPVINTKSSNIDQPPSLKLTFPYNKPEQPSTPSVNGDMKNPIVSNPKTKRLRNELIIPQQIPQPRYSRSYRHSGTSGRRSRTRKHRYRAKPQINLNAKPGSRINYVIPKGGNADLSHNNNRTKRETLTYRNDPKTISEVNNMKLYIRKNELKNWNTDRNRQNPNVLKMVQPQSAASLDAQRDVKDGFNRHSFNVNASNAIPVVRPLPDTRPKSCHFKPTSKTATMLPMATVVICFHNEAWSTLLRTIHSVLARSPRHLLKEIILVDDYSAYDYLGAKLETYISRFPQIQLVRTHKREGLIRARLLGVSYARGDVLVFLDSHCECNTKWLEPLLDALIDDRKKIVCPQIDIINPDTFAYERAPSNLHGGFNWLLQFVWKEVPQHGNIIRRMESDALSTPTMIGGLFAVNRRYFLDIGGYDPGMEIWGGENLELSFRVWMCGGSIEILPCSRVGHVFRPVIPYGFPGGARQTLHHNAMRVAEVWMDQYKKFYYASTELPRNASMLSSLGDRHQLRQSLKCNDFDWYLRNIIPEMDIPPLNAQYYGQVLNRNLHYCLHFSEADSGLNLKVSPCQQQMNAQQFTLTSGGEFVHYFKCIYLLEDLPALAPCNKVSQRWTVSEAGQIVASKVPQVAAQMCLDVLGFSVTVTSCDPSKTSQLWTFTYRFDMNKLNVRY